MTTSAQISVYPLRQERLGPAVESVRNALEEHGLTPQVGPMSTTVIGESGIVFAALADAFAKAASSWPSGHDHHDFQRLPGPELILQMAADAMAPDAYFEWSRRSWSRHLCRLARVHTRRDHRVTGTGTGSAVGRASIRQSCSGCRLRGRDPHNRIPPQGSIICRRLRP